MQSSSIFRNYFVSSKIRLDDKEFIRRLENLQRHLRQNYEIEEIEGGWKCTPKKEYNPSYLVTPDTVLFVMKQLGF